MKKLLLAFFMLSCFSSKGQYFDWNTTTTIYDIMFHETGYIERFEVNNNGGLMLRVDDHPCMSCGSDIIETYYNSNGNITGNYVTSNFGISRSTYFDHAGNIIHVKGPPQSNLTYFRPADTLIISFNNNLEPSFIEADLSKILYVGYKYVSSIDTIKRFDSTGTPLLNLAADFINMKADDLGNVFLYYHSSLATYGIITKFDGTNTQVAQYTVKKNAPYEITRSGRLWFNYNDTINCYDSTGLLYTIPLMSNSSPQLISDRFENLYVFMGNQIKKYAGDSLILATKFNGSGSELFGIDDNLNIYYAGNYYSFSTIGLHQEYTQIHGDVPFSINLPPNLFNSLILPDDAFDLIGKHLYIGKISNASLDTFYANISYVGQNSSSKLCTSTYFDVGINYYHLPTQYGSESVFIELSDTNGSFGNPTIIGIGTGLNIVCQMSGSIVPGNGYKMRMRLGNGLYFSNPFTTDFKISNRPSVSIYLDNSMNNASCYPFKYVASFDSLFSYDWYSYDSGIDEYTYYGINSHILSDPIYYDEIGVIVTNISTGCTGSAFDICCPYVLDSLNYDLSIYVILHPDTLKINDPPVKIFTVNGATLSGQGVHYNNTEHVYYFYPDSVIPGLIPITETLPHFGTPCIPYTYTDYVYVDSVRSNIITDDVASPNNHLCQGDTFDVPFILLDSTVYDSTNIFVVEMNYLSYNLSNKSYKYIFDSNLGSGVTSPIKCIAPDPVSNINNRFRVVSTQTSEKGTFNSNGGIIVADKPTITPLPGYLNSNCFVDTIRLSTNSSYHTMNLYYHDSLIYTQTTQPFKYAPQQDGFYKLELIGECTNIYDSIEVNHSTHTPVLSPITKSNNLCGSNTVLLTVASDSLTSLQWFSYQDTLHGETNDSLLVSVRGIYTVYAVSKTGCSMTRYSTIVLNDNPAMIISPAGDNFQICPGDTLKISNVYLPSYSYKWLRNDSIISTNNYLNIVDTGSYKVIVTGTQNCIDTSETIHISYSVQRPAISPVGPLTLLNGGSVTLTSTFNPAYQYQWTNYNINISGATQTTLSINQSGIYRIIAMDSLGCNKVSTPVAAKRVFIPTDDVPSTLRGQNKEQPLFTLFPNPNNGTFTLKSDDIVEGEYSLFIFDLYGRIINQSMVIPIEGKLNQEIVLNGIADGIYTLQLKSPSNSDLIPLLISR